MPPVTRTDFPYPLRTVDGEVDVEVDNLTVNGNLTVENFIFINDINVGNAIINNNLIVGNTVSTVNVNATNIIAGTLNSTSLTTTTINSQSVTTNSLETVSAKITGLANLSAVATNATNDLISVPNTGLGNNVLQTTPTLITPILGDAQGTSLTLSTPLPPSSGGTGQTSLSLVTVGNATQASQSTNLSGGSLGRIPVQSAPSTTTFLNPGLSGQILTSDGTQPSYQFPAIVPLTSGVSGILPPTNGGTGQTSLSLVTVGNATQAAQSTNISDGAIGQIPYQIAPSTTAFTGPGTPGQILTSNGNAQPTYQAPAIVSLTSGVSGTLPPSNGGTGQTSLSLVTVGNSTTTQNLGGGAIGSVAVQTGVGSTGFVGVGLAGTILTSNGTNPVYQPPAIVSLTTGVSGVLPVLNGGTGQTTLSAVTVGNATSAVSSVNLSGGSLGSVAVQTGVGSTGFITPSVAGGVLRSLGTGVSPQFSLATLPTVQSFTTGGPASYTSPTGCVYILVYCVGAGGGGGGSSFGAGNQGAGGGGGGTTYGYLAAGTYAMTYGIGGAGGAGVGGVTGSNGTVSTFGSLTGNFGSGGDGGATDPTFGGNGGGGNSGTLYAGDSGQPPSSTSGGNGGRTLFTRGGRGGFYAGATTTATPKVGMNGGGGGGAASANIATAGAAGGNGFIVVHEFYQ